MSDPVAQTLSEIERRERIAHQDAILDIRAIVTSRSGMRFFKYLFDTLDVGELPEMGLEGNQLAERIGMLRAGNAIFKIVSEANHEIAAQLLAAIEKERYEKLYGKNTTG